jgi:hypothetical protein
MGPWTTPEGNAERKIEESRDAMREPRGFRSKENAEQMRQHKEPTGVGILERRIGHSYPKVFGVY